MKGYCTLRAAVLQGLRRPVKARIAGEQGAG